MGKVIRLQVAEHQEVRLLLPWFATGRLEAADHARVKAHIAHCASCRAELRRERRLRAEVVDLPLAVDRGWAAMLERLQPPSAEPRRLWRVGRLWFGWALAAGLGAVLVASVIWPRFSTAPPLYHTLAEPPPSRPGNLMVLFQPNATEAQIRTALNASDARLVDGPTAADAYVLNVPAIERPKALATLRRIPQVIAAEPIDPPAAR
jgi:hypothetical protein